MLSARFHGQRPPVATILEESAVTDGEYLDVFPANSVRNLYIPQSSLVGI